MASYRVAFRRPQLCRIITGMRFYSEIFHAARKAWARYRRAQRLDRLPTSVCLSDHTFNSEYEQTITINITSLPAGAKRRVAISIPDIKSFYSGAGVPASTVGGFTRSGGGEIPPGNTNLTETGSTYN